ncbi:MAG: hypothetical protein DMD26_18995 [Gemmatimonadetes bacterium]|nr:MAG: hypothetical protein DMD26_18995 [Gemmatimonadota bacterium]
MDQIGRDLRAHDRRIILGAHDGARDAISGLPASVYRQHHGDAGGSQRLGRTRPPRRHPGQLPREWRCRHRHVSHRGRARAEVTSSRRRAPQDPAAGSDFSPGPFAPLMGIQGMVTRTGWDGKTWGANQRITVDEAIRVNTVNGAYAAHEESLKGSITEGKLADFVVLADDPHTVSKDKIKDIQIVRTVVGGATKYQS